MAEAKGQAEPTMEEILASIRRIISEDDPDREAPQAAAPDKAEAQAVPEVEPEPDPLAEPAAVPGIETELVAAPSDDNVLDLTQKLNDDGTVVDLAAERAAANDAVEPEPEPEPEPEMAAEPEAGPEPEPEPDLEMAAESEPGPAPDSEPEMATEPVVPPPVDEESLLAPETQAATTGILSEIAKAAASGRRAGVHVGDGRTLEDIVREALTPELKAWLDANLAPLVEQIVRDEVKKMVRRAEEL